MPKEIKRTLVRTAGAVFVVLGILGLALPFLQGILFLAIGLILLSIASSRTRAWIASHTIRYPKFHALVQKAEKWITDIIGTVDEAETMSDSNPKN